MATQEERDEFYWYAIEMLAQYGYAPGSSDIVIDLELKGFVERTQPDVSNEYAEFTGLGRHHFHMEGHELPEREL